MCIVHNHDSHWGFELKLSFCLSLMRVLTVQAGSAFSFWSRSRSASIRSRYARQVSWARLTCSSQALLPFVCTGSAHDAIVAGQCSTLDATQGIGSKTLLGWTVWQAYLSLQVRDHGVQHCAAHDLRCHTHHESVACRRRDLHRQQPICVKTWPVHVSCQGATRCRHAHGHRAL